MYGSGTLTLVEGVDQGAVLVNYDSTAVPPDRVHARVYLGGKTKLKWGQFPFLSMTGIFVRILEKDKKGKFVGAFIVEQSGSCLADIRQETVLTFFWSSPILIAYSMSMETSSSVS